MAKRVGRDSAGLADDTEEDTIELMLHPQELGALSRAAAEGCSESAPAEAVEMRPRPGSSHSESRRGPAKLDLKLRLRRIPFESATVIAVIAITLASAAYRSASTPTQRAEDRLAYVSRSEETTSAPRGDPVRIRNPFDPSEVFEFPPGTSEAVARASAANLLLERGRERLEQPNATKSLNSFRAARSSTRTAAADRRIPPGPTH